jgi:hypothetical protein
MDFRGDYIEMETYTRQEYFRICGSKWHDIRRAGTELLHSVYFPVNITNMRISHNACNPNMGEMRNAHKNSTRKLNVRETWWDPMTGFCKYSNNPSATVEGGEFSKIQQKYKNFISVFLLNVSVVSSSTSTSTNNNNNNNNNNNSSSSSSSSRSSKKKNNSNSNNIDTKCVMMGLDNQCQIWKDMSSC